MFELPDVENLEEVVVSDETINQAKPPVYVYATDNKKKKKSKEEKEPEAAAS